MDKRMNARPLPRCEATGRATRRLRRAALALLLLGCASQAARSEQAPADPPPGVIETPMRDPWVPPSQRQPSASPPTSGAELRAQVERKLEASFDAADVDRTGTLTRAQAKAAGLGFIASHFDEIDTRRSGVIRFDDVRAFLAGRAARARPRN